MCEGNPLECAIAVMLMQSEVNITHAAVDLHHKQANHIYKHLSRTFILCPEALSILSFACKGERKIWYGDTGIFAQYYCA